MLVLWVVDNASVYISKFSSYPNPLNLVVTKQLMNLDNISVDHSIDLLMFLNFRGAAPARCVQYGRKYLSKFES